MVPHVSRRKTWLPLLSNLYIQKIVIGCWIKWLIWNLVNMHSDRIKFVSLYPHPPTQSYLYNTKQCWMLSKILNLEISKFRIWTGTQIQIYDLARMSLKFKTITPLYSPPDYWSASNVKCCQTDKKGLENNWFVLKSIWAIFFLLSLFWFCFLKECSLFFTFLFGFWVIWIAYFTISGNSAFRVSKTSF